MKNKKLATFLALFLGGFGVHRFYLGQRKYGWLYLGFCWTLVPVLLGLIDAICFACMSRAAFNLKYSLKHVFAKKFEDEEALHHASFDRLREEMLLKKIEEMKNKELIQLFLQEAKKEGNYLPRTVYARAKSIIEDTSIKAKNTLD